MAGAISPQSSRCCAAEPTPSSTSRTADGSNSVGRSASEGAEEHGAGGGGGVPCSSHDAYRGHGPSGMGQRDGRIGIATVPWGWDRSEMRQDVKKGGLAAGPVMAGHGVRSADVAQKSGKCGGRKATEGRDRDRILCDAPLSLKAACGQRRIILVAPAMIAGRVAHVMCRIPKFQHPQRHARSSIRNTPRVRPQI